jgi:tetratricopeptide (TPR) repeat protein
MTIVRILLIGTFLFIAAGASAQEPSPFPVPAQPTLPAPAVPATADLARPTPGDGDRRKVVKSAFAQAEKKTIAVAAAAKVEPNVFFREPNAPESWYSQARAWIDRDQYDRALEPLDKVIVAKASRADAAMYWKAYSLLKLARRDEALSTLEQMQKQHPDSRWLRDARALEVEAKQAAGQSVTTNVADDDLKLLALNGIMRTDPEAALPVVEKLLAGGASVRLKERALFVLSQNKNDRAREIIASVARSTSNPDLQLLAIRYLGVSSSPEGVATLLMVYRSDSSMDTRKAIVSALASAHNNAAATNALITLARAERNSELRTSIVRHLSMSSAPEARAYMLEFLK